MKRQRDPNSLYCFSPPVMIATFAIEIGLALYTLLRYKQNAVTRLIVLMLAALATFQLAEFMVCRGSDGGSLMWPRIGLVAITILPPLGIHLVYSVVKASKRSLLLPAYAAAAFFLAFFGLAGNSIDGHSCMGNYVIFQVAPGFGGLYGLYYYALLVTTLSLGWYYLRHVTNKKIKRVLGGIMTGYAVFLIPATTVNLLMPETLSAIPSIMCGFAVLLALMLSFVVLPAVGEKKKAKR